MPSRKRSQGKARRAKADNLPIASYQHDDSGWWFSNQWEGCRHGQPLCPPPGHPVRRFLDAFQVYCEETCHDGVSAEAAMTFAITSTQKKHPNVLNGEHRGLLRLVFLSNLAHCLLGERDPHPAIVGYIMMMEEEDPETGSSGAMCCLKKSDILNGCAHSLMKFVSKRTSCPCLVVKYAEVRGSLTKVGICSHCNTRKGRRALMVCTSCEMVQYCSKQCQVSHWPDHREDCKCHLK